jgi:hypothetical protein
MLRVKKSLSKAAGIKSGDREAPKGKESLQTAVSAAGERKHERRHHIPYGRKRMGLTAARSAVRCMLLLDGSRKKRNEALWTSTERLSQSNEICLRIELSLQRVQHHGPAGG